MILFYGNLLTPRMGCIQTAVSVATVTENVCMGRRWKAELVAYRICSHPSPRIGHLRPLKPDHSSFCLVCLESVQQLILTSKPRNYQTGHRSGPY
jgi:hypothetical protein